MVGLGGLHWSVDAIAVGVGWLDATGVAAAVLVFLFGVFVVLVLFVSVVVVVAVVVFAHALECDKRLVRIALCHLGPPGPRLGSSSPGRMCCCR